MGTWGTGLFDDDLAADLQTEFEERVNSGLTPENAAVSVKFFL